MREKKNRPLEAQAAPRRKKQARFAVLRQWLSKPQLPSPEQLKSVLLSLGVYALTAGIAAGWLLFFDRYNYFSQKEVSRQIQSLERDKAYYEQAMQRIDYQHNKIFSDPSELERYAREQYYLRRPNEDVFVITESAAAPN